MRTERRCVPCSKLYSGAAATGILNSSRCIQHWSLAEREAQDAEKDRPAFRNVGAVRAFIANTNSAVANNVSLEMCMLAIKEQEKSWYLELADPSMEERAETALPEYQGPDYARCSKYIFQLSLWKNRNHVLNEATYRVGISYRFEKVHLLRLQYDCTVGSAAIRQGLDTTPLSRQATANSPKTQAKWKSRVQESRGDVAAEPTAKKSRPATEL
ncbi:hypothetical protein GQ600_7379 [Phytophthora cactorum]|nr:hypothetical protein GQ600_7379 [Phytophthora cactorum]